ncbi:TerD family protein [Halopseudomonas pelagia]|uniref:Stress protein n=1 Tax=Halopseudomonas pelagia TaxID=553151 RepID=A0AA91Z5S7_9GAMM|nr:TerD family protein [Halopseudomonas pelagia]PCC99198.1 stress protein [Halopseudomonas pelagia]QFY57029.1 TerD family protein [Halopseudomonas pelagia]
MALSLAKNQTISLEKTAGNGLKKVRMGVGWDPVQKAKSSGGFLSRMLGGGGSSDSIDLDASCIMMDENKAAIDVVMFSQLKSKDGSIKHSGDNLTGEGDGDDETIFVDLLKLPTAVKYLVFTVNSFRGQTFNEVENAYCRIVNEEGDEELARLTLSEKGSHTGMIMAYLTRTTGGWDMTAVGREANGRTARDLATEAAGVIV